MNILKSKGLVWLVVATLGLSSCWNPDDFENIAVDPIKPTFGFPLINSVVSILDLLDAVSADTMSFVQIRNDSIILCFSERFRYQLYLTIPDNQFGTTLPVLPYSFDVVYDDYTTIENESEVKSIAMKGGELVVEFTKDFPEDIDALLTLPSLFNGETSFQAVASWSDDPYRSLHSLDLNGWQLDLFRVDGNDTIFNDLRYTVEVASEGGVSGFITLNIAFRSIDYSRITGEIYYRKDIPRDEVNLSLFESVSSGRLYLDNPSIELNIGSSFGTPISVQIDTFEFDNTNDSEPPIVLTSVQGINNTLLIGQPNYLPNATLSNPYITKRYTLSGQNSNLADAIAIGPNRVILSGSYNLGEAEQALNSHNFFLIDTSSITIDMDLELPLSGSIEGFTLNFNIADMDWPDFEDIEFIDDYDISVLLKSTNGIPLTFAMQARFKDSNSIVIDSLFAGVTAENIIQSPSIDGNGEPIDFYEKTTIIRLTKEKYDNMLQATETEFVFTVNSGDGIQKNVIIRPSHSLGIKMSIVLNAEISHDF